MIFFTMSLHILVRHLGPAVNSMDVLEFFRHVDGSISIPNRSASCVTLPCPPTMSAFASSTSFCFAIVATATA
jgi:hypothetical protein